MPATHMANLLCTLASNSPTVYDTQMHASYAHGVLSHVLQHVHITQQRSPPRAQATTRPKQQQQDPLVKAWSKPGQTLSESKLPAQPAAHFTGRQAQQLFRHQSLPAYCLAEALLCNHLTDTTLLRNMPLTHANQTTQTPHRVQSCQWQEGPSKHQHTTYAQNKQQSFSDSSCYQLPVNMPHPRRMTQHVRGNVWCAAINAHRPLTTKHAVFAACVGPYSGQ